MKQRWWRRAWVLGAALGALTSFADAQQVPQILTVQGYLTDTNGAPVNATQLTVQATLYDDPAASGDSNRLYQVIRRVDVTNGNFSLLLGRPPGNASDPPIEDSVVARSNLWVGIAVGSDSEMSPRLRVSAVPYALRAASADTLQGRAPRSCPTGTLDMGSFCIDPNARTGNPTDAMEVCYTARGHICGVQELFNGCRRARNADRVAFNTVNDQWIVTGVSEWYHSQDDAAVMQAVQFSASSCLSRSTVVWTVPGRQEPRRFYCCYAPSPTLRGE